MATAVAGKGGAVKINGTPVTTVALVNDWAGSITQALYPSEALGDQWTTDVSGMQTMTGTVKGMWSVTSDAGQTALHNAILNGLTVGLNLQTNGAGDGYDLTAHISQFDTDNPVNGLVAFTANFRSHGQVFFT